MEIHAIKKWLVFFLCILAAIVMADWLSNIIVTAAGISGWSRFLTGFILYAGLFFAILYGMEKVFGISFFCVNLEEQ